jgi:antitoxin YefM
LIREPASAEGSGPVCYDRTMNAVTLQDAKLNLEQLVADVIANADDTIIVTESGEQVVLMPLDEYNSWQETLYLLRNPANAEHLQRSIAEAQMSASENPMS